jgi:hypothetical protein
MLCLNQVFILFFRLFLFLPRYYYLQEAINHPIAIGWHKVQPQLTDIYQRVITQGLLGKQVTQNVSSDDVDEFAMMGGM